MIWNLKIKRFLVQLQNSVERFWHFHVTSFYDLAGGQDSLTA